MSIVSFVQAGSTKLPNDIIMKIVKEADGGLTTHKKKFKATLDNIKLGGDCVISTTRQYTPQGLQEVPTQFLAEWGEYNETDLYGGHPEDGVWYSKKTLKRWEDRLKLLFGELYAEHFHNSVCWNQDEESSEDED